MGPITLTFREFFRIVVPGAYAYGLLRYLAPDLEPAWVFTDPAASVALTLLLGFVGLGLTPHRIRIRGLGLWPYSRDFSVPLAGLIAAIKEASGGGGPTEEQSPDKDTQKAIYKYFLETKVPSALADRIHYFSSLSYLLETLSAISALAVLGAVVGALYVPAIVLGFLAVVFRTQAKAQWKDLLKEEEVLVRDMSGSLQDIMSRQKGHR